jgi:hypothetical protein
MATVTETWYVRLPNGRTVRVASAELVRRYLRAGRIPPESRARRLGDERWLPLARIAEFAGVLRMSRPTVRPAAPRRTRPANNETRPPGVRGVIEELLTALDSTLTGTKLSVAALVGVAIAIGYIAMEWAAELPVGASALAAYAGAALFIVAAVALASALLTRMTVMELDRHGSARAAGLGWTFVRIAVAQALVTAVVLCVLFGVRALVPLLAASDWGDLDGLRDVLAGLLAVVHVLIEVLAWPVLAVAILLLGPLLVIEDDSIGVGLRGWLGMLRGRLRRIYLYEALAFLVANTLALPLVLMVVGAAYAIGDGLGAVERDVLLLLGGAALGPAIAYLLVANVFVYINLRYEFYFAQGQRKA